MSRRGTGAWVAGVAGVAQIVACAARGPGDVAPVPPVAPAPARAPAPSAAPTATADARGCPAPQGGARGWTTLPATDICCEFGERQGPSFSRVATRAECEAWTRERRCRPGWSCYDGCNSLSCSNDGLRVHTTLLDCAVLGVVPFEHGSVRLSEAVEIDTLVRLLASPERRLIVAGEAGPDEGTAGQRRALAEGRAKAVHARLLELGAPADRVEIRLGADSGQAPHGLPRVTVTPEPSYPTRYDFPADACERRRYCWCDDAP